LFSVLCSSYFVRFLKAHYKAQSSKYKFRKSAIGNWKLKIP